MKKVNEQPQSETDKQVFYVPNVGAVEAVDLADVERQLKKKEQEALDGNS